MGLEHDAAVRPVAWLSSSSNKLQQWAGFAFRGTIPLFHLVDLFIRYA